MLKTETVTLVSISEMDDKDFDSFMDSVETFADFWTAVDAMPTGGLDNSLDI